MGFDNRHFEAVGSWPFLASAFSEHESACRITDAADIVRHRSVDDVDKGPPVPKSILCATGEPGIALRNPGSVKQLRCTYCRHANNQHKWAEIRTKIGHYVYRDNEEDVTRNLQNLAISRFLQC